MQRSFRAAMVLAVGAVPIGLAGCAQILGLDDRNVTRSDDAAAPTSHDATTADASSESSTDGSANGLDSASADANADGANEGSMPLPDTGAADSGATCVVDASRFCASQAVTFCDDFDDPSGGNVLQAWCQESWTATQLMPSGSAVSIVTGVSPTTPSPPGSLLSAAAAVTGGMSVAQLGYVLAPPRTTAPFSFTLAFEVLLPSDCSISSPTGRAWVVSGVELAPAFALVLVVTPAGGVILSQITGGTPNPTMTGANISAGVWTNVQLAVTLSSTTSGTATVTVGGVASSPIAITVTSGISTTSWQFNLGLGTPSGVTTTGCSADFDNVTFNTP